MYRMGFLGGSVVKNLPANAGDTGLIPGSGISPGGGNGNPLQYSCLENLHGQRSLVGYSSWCHKESDMTERLSTAQNKVTPNLQTSQGVFGPQPLSPFSS